ncbi:hypothetical protein JCM8547_008589 [Rhodosporidiobolus lusitaniae]
MVEGNRRARQSKRAAAHRQKQQEKQQQGQGQSSPGNSRSHTSRDTRGQQQRHAQYSTYPHQHPHDPYAPPPPSHPPHPQPHPHAYPPQPAPAPYPYQDQRAAYPPSQEPQSYPPPPTRSVYPPQASSYGAPPAAAAYAAPDPYYGAPPPRAAPPPSAPPRAAWPPAPPAEHRAAPPAGYAHPSPPAPAPPSAYRPHAAPQNPTSYRPSPVPTPSYDAPPPARSSFPPPPCQATRPPPQEYHRPSPAPAPPLSTYRSPFPPIQQQPWQSFPPARATPPPSSFPPPQRQSFPPVRAPSHPPSAPPVGQAAAAAGYAKWAAPPPPPPAAGVAAQVTQEEAEPALFSLPGQARSRAFPAAAAQPVASPPTVPPASVCTNASPVNAPPAVPLSALHRPSPRTVPASPPAPTAAPSVVPPPHPEPTSSAVPSLPTGSEAASRAASPAVVQGAEPAEPAEEQLEAEEKKDGEAVQPEDGFISFDGLTSAPTSVVDGGEEVDKAEDGVEKETEGKEQDEDEDESDNEVADALVRKTSAVATKRKSSLVALGLPLAGEAHDSVMEDDLSPSEPSASSDEADSDDDDASDISDLEGAVQGGQAVDEEEDEGEGAHGGTHDLPFDLGSEDEDGTDVDGEDDGAEGGHEGDESIDVTASLGRRNKRRKLNRADPAGEEESAPPSAATSRAGSPRVGEEDAVSSSVAIGAFPERVTKPLPQRKVVSGQQQQHQAQGAKLPRSSFPPLPPSSTFSAVPSNLSSVLSALLPLSTPAAASQELASSALSGTETEVEMEDGHELEEGEVSLDGPPEPEQPSLFEPSSSALLAGFNDGPPSAASLLSATPFTFTVPPTPVGRDTLSSSLKPAELAGQAQVTTPSGAEELALLPGSALSASASAASLSNGKASYQRRAPGSAPSSAPSAVPPSAVPFVLFFIFSLALGGKLAVRRREPPSAAPPLVDPIPSSGVLGKGVYVRRQPDEAPPAAAPVAILQTAPPPAAPQPFQPAAPPGKAAYERPAGGVAKRPKKNRSSGVLPLLDEEKEARLPVKFYAGFSSFPDPASAALPSLYAPPTHHVNPAKNLPPPNEAATHGYWPSPPSLKAGKAVFPAPPTPLPDAPEDLRPRVDVFIDNSNVLYSFLNWVRARPDAKISSKAMGAAGKVGKTVKTVTLGGKKVKMDYDVLFALLERGRKVERRVLVGSSTLWQTLEPAVEWGYEISLLQRVPRLEPASNPNQQQQQQQQSKKRGKNGKLKQQKPQIVQPATVKHFKEQAVDELVHLKILESLLDHTPSPLPLVDPFSAPEPTLPPSLDAMKEAEQSAVQAAATEDGAADDDAAEGTDGKDAVEGEGAGELASCGSASADAGAAAAAATTQDEQGSAAIQTENGEQSILPSAEVALAALTGAELVESGEDVGAVTANAVMVEEANKKDGEQDSTEEQEKKPTEDETVLQPSSDVEMVEQAKEAQTDGSTTTTTTADHSLLAAETSAAVENAAAAPPAKASRFQPSAAYTSGKVTVATLSAPVTTPAPPTSTTSKFSPAVPKTASSTSKFTPAAVPKLSHAPAPAAPPPPPPLLSDPLTMPILPRQPARERPTLVIATGDANSSEYNPGGFLGCVQRALDRGWDVEVVAFTHGLSSHWTAEQMKRVTADGRERGELRVVNLGWFAEELCA